MVEQLWGEDDVGNQRGEVGKGEVAEGGNGGRGDGLSEKGRNCAEIPTVPKAYWRLLQTLSMLINNCGF